ncbi:hypothetical protein KSS87_018678 [Heliosperma pusillum]|nr:hypothetical protein KSS87_018678 [Heliosperma pusillum]
MGKKSCFWSKMKCPSHRVSYPCPSVECPTWVREIIMKSPSNIDYRKRFIPCIVFHSKIGYAITDMHSEGIITNLQK